MTLQILIALGALIIGLLAYAVYKVVSTPVGYENENGFNYGFPEDEEL